VEHCHCLSADEVLHKLQSGLTGLSEAEAARRLQHYGHNTLPGVQHPSALKRFLLQFHNILIYVLLVCVLITALLDHYIDAFVIFAVVLINAVIGFVQEGKAEKAIDAIRQMLAPTAAVRRVGKRRTLAAELLVPGDIVLLEAGDKVPADLRLVQSSGMQIQEAILTGESVPVEKSTEVSAPQAPLGDRCGMAYSGTLVTTGQGVGVVVATGLHTEMGRISGLLAGIETLRTPLVQKMEVFARWLTGVILAVSVLLLLYGYYVQGISFVDLFMAVVGLAVAAIPEGLPAILTITLAIGVQTMARQNAIVRRLPAIETLGAVSVICTDKTGTLTRNEMQVTAFCLAAHTLPVPGNGYATDGDIDLTGAALTAAEQKTLAQMALTASLCNDAQLHMTQEHWQVSGDPMEGALLAFAAKAARSTQLDPAGHDSVRCPASLHGDAEPARRQRQVLHLREGRSGKTGRPLHFAGGYRGH
jgi:magnesium-transporting ATPase (P-type)